MSTIMVSLLQLVVSALVLGGGCAYLAHYVKADKRPRRKQKGKASSPRLASAHHGA